MWRCVVLTRVTGRHIPEDIIHSHRSKNLKSYKHVILYVEWQLLFWDLTQYRNVRTERCKIPNVAFNKHPFGVS
jgi:hypothetical protein